MTKATGRGRRRFNPLRSVGTHPNGSADREQQKALSDYLAALTTPRKRGRKRDLGRAAARLEEIKAELRHADPLRALSLRQERLDLQADLRLRASESTREADLKALEEGFVAVAREYSARKGITYQAWREAGVRAAVLKRAGLEP